MMLHDEELEREFEAFRAAGESATLLDAAVLVARGDDPALDERALRERVETLGRAAHAHVSRYGAFADRVDGLCHYLHEVRGFRGADDDYYRYENSYLPHVLAIGRGIPIALAVVYVTVGRRLELDCEGVNFPGHFLVRARPEDAEQTALLIDPFAGRTVSHADCEARLAAMAGPGADVRLGPQHLQTARPQDVLVRMLNNLKQLALADSDLPRALDYARRILWARPEALGEHRDRALMFEQLGRYEEAAVELERLAGSLDDGEVREAVWRQIEALRDGGRGRRTVH